MPTTARRAPAAREAGAAALTTPAVDAWSAGGASLLVLGVFALLPGVAASSAMAAAITPLSALLNWPHFMASYGLLYSMPGAAKRHPFATGVVPVLLVVWAAAAFALYARVPLLARLLHATGGVYLAWHYTGQAWGAMAAYARVEELRVDDASRRLLRANLYCLLAWHAAWAASLVARAVGPAVYEPFYRAVSAVAAASALLGAAGLYRLARAWGRLPARVLLPWLAIHAWYLLIWRAPSTAYWVQLAQMSHAAQYLVFTLRVDLNRQNRTLTAASAGRYLGLLVLAGLAAFKLLPAALDALASWAAAPGPAGLAGLLVTDALVIHHYFVDGCVWKLRSREVAGDLLRHLA